MEQSIVEYTNFGGSEYDVRKVFSLVEEFFVSQGSESHIKDYKEVPGLGNHHPFKNQLKPSDSKKVTESLSLLKDYHKQLSN